MEFVLKFWAVSEIHIHDVLLLVRQRGVRVSINRSLLLRKGSRIMTREALAKMVAENARKSAAKASKSAWGVEDIESDMSVRTNIDTTCGSCLGIIDKLRMHRNRGRMNQEVKVILNGVTSYFNSGDLVAVMGPSGSGKTTFMDLITGRRSNSNVSVSASFFRFKLFVGGEW